MRVSGPSSSASDLSHFLFVYHCEASALFGSDGELRVLIDMRFTLHDFSLEDLCWVFW